MKERQEHIKGILGTPVGVVPSSYGTIGSHEGAAVARPISPHEAAWGRARGGGPWRSSRGTARGRVRHVDDGPRGEASGYEQERDLPALAEPRGARGGGLRANHEQRACRARYGLAA